MNLPDKTRVTFAGDLFWYFSSKNAESGVFYCRLQIFEIVEARYKLPTIFFHHFSQKIVSLAKLSALNFSMLGVLDAINKSKPYDCERNLSPMILIGNQMVYS